MTLEQIITEIRKAGPVAVPVQMHDNELEVIVNKQDLIEQIRASYGCEFAIYDRGSYRIIFGY